jgi:HAD superfamily hydrolase (TIGR01509 family)
VSAAVAAVVFDLDGVLVDTEPYWADAKRELVADAGGEWREDAATEMLGMSGPEWSEYMRKELGVPLEADEIGRRVVDGMLGRIAEGVPLLPGAREAITAIAERWPVAIASSADRPVIEAVLRETELESFVDVVVSSGETGRGKPAPDVYLAAAEQLGVAPQAAVAIEDSGNGMLSAKAAEMALIAIPNPNTAVDDSALAQADVVLSSIAELTPEAVERAHAAVR